jgi:cysteine-rich repeat protein
MVESQGLQYYGETCSTACDAKTACGGNGFCGFDGKCVCFSGYSLDPQTGTCRGVCGDKLLASTEECDDGNMVAGDGCSSGCKVEQGWSCSLKNAADGSLCTPELDCATFFASSSGDRALYVAWSAQFETVAPADLALDVKFSLTKDCPVQGTQSMKTITIKVDKSWPTFKQSNAAFSSTYLSQINAGVVAGNTYTASAALSTAKGPGKTCTFSKSVIVTARPTSVQSLTVQEDTAQRQVCVTWSAPSQLGYGCSTPAGPSIFYNVHMSRDGFATLASRSPVRGASNLCFSMLPAGVKHSFRVMACNDGICGCCGASGEGCTGQAPSTCSVEYTPKVLTRVESVIPSKTSMDGGDEMMVALSNVASVSVSDFTVIFSGMTSGLYRIIRSSRAPVFRAATATAPSSLMLYFITPKWTASENVDVMLNVTGINTADLSFQISYFEPTAPRMLGLTPSTALTSGGNTISLRVANSKITSMAAASSIEVEFGSYVCNDCIDDIKVVDVGVTAIYLKAPKLALAGEVEVSVRFRAALLFPAFKYTFVLPCDYETFCGTMGETFELDEEEMEINPPTDSKCMARYCVDVQTIPSPQIMSSTPECGPTTGGYTMTVIVQDLQYTSASQVYVTFGAMAGVVTSMESTAGGTMSMITIQVPELGAEVCPGCDSFNEGCGAEYDCSVDVVVWSSMYADLKTEVSFCYTYFPTIEPSIGLLSAGCSMDDPVEICQDEESMAAMGEAFSMTVDLNDFPVTSSSNYGDIRLVLNGTDVAARVISSSIKVTRVSFSFVANRGGEWPVTIYHRANRTKHSSRFRFYSRVMQPKINRLQPVSIVASRTSSVRLSFSYLKYSVRRVRLVYDRSVSTCSQIESNLTVSGNTNVAKGESAIDVAVPALIGPCAYGLEVMFEDGSTSTFHNQIEAFAETRFGGMFPKSGGRGTVLTFMFMNMKSKGASAISLWLNGAAFAFTIKWEKDGDAGIEAVIPKSYAMLSGSVTIRIEYDDIVLETVSFFIEAAVPTVFPTVVPLKSAYPIEITVYDVLTAAEGKVGVLLDGMAVTDFTIVTPPSVTTYTVIQVTLPDQDEAGFVRGRVTLNRDLGYYQEFEVERFAAPKITIRPSRGNIKGGDELMIQLENFPPLSSLEGMDVFFGSMRARITEELGDDTFICILPEQEEDEEVLVTVAPSVDTNSFDFKKRQAYGLVVKARTAKRSFHYFRSPPSLRLEPSRGGTSGSSMITIFGTNFPQIFETDGIIVSFGGEEGLGYVTDILFSDKSDFGAVVQVPMGSSGRVQLQAAVGLKFAVTDFEFYDDRVTITCGIPQSYVTFEITVATCVSKLKEAPCSADLSELNITVYEEFQNCSMKPEECAYALTSVEAGADTGDSGLNFWNTADDLAVRVRGGEYAVALSLEGYYSMVQYINVKNFEMRVPISLSPILEANQQRVVMRWPVTALIPDLDLFIIPTINGYLFDEPTYLWQEAPNIPTAPLAKHPTFQMTLDRDDMLDNFHPGTHGPETATITDMPAGDYAIWVHVFPSGEDGALDQMSAMILDLMGPVEVDIYCGGNCIDTDGTPKKGWVDTVRQTEVNNDENINYEWWNVGSFEYDNEFVWFKRCTNNCYRIRQNPPYAIDSANVVHPLEDGYETSVGRAATGTAEAQAQAPQALRKQQAKAEKEDRSKMYQEWLEAKEASGSGSHIKKASAAVRDNKHGITKPRLARRNHGFARIITPSVGAHTAKAHVKALNTHGKRKLLQDDDDYDYDYDTNTTTTIEEEMIEYTMYEDVSLYTSECMAKTSGGEIVMLSVTNMPPITRASDMLITVGGTPAELRSWQMMEDGIEQVLFVSMPALKAANQDADGETTVELTIVNMLLEGQANALFASSVSIDITYVSTPAAVKAEMDVTGSMVTMSMNVPTDMAGMGGGTFACEEFFDLETVEQLGMDSVCYWESTQDLGILLGAGASLSPGSMIRSQPNKLRSANGVSDYAEYVFAIVMAPMGSVAPTFTLETAAVISVCDTMSISAVYSSYRPYSFVWSCIKCGEEDDAKTKKFADEVSYITGPALMLPPSKLPFTDYNYTFSVHAVSFLGAKSRPSTVSVTVSQLSVPVVSIATGSQMYDRTQDVYAVASIEFSSCGGGEAEAIIEWGQIDGPMLIPPERLSTPGPMLYIPAGVLKAGRYGVNLTVSLPSLTPPQTVIAFKYFTIDSSSLVAIITGGSRAVSSLEDIVIDGSESYDPDEDPEEEEEMLSMEWFCVDEDDQPCRDMDFEELQFRPNVETHTIPGNSLWEGEYTITLIVGRGLRFSSTSVTIVVVDEYVPPAGMVIYDAFEQDGTIYVNVEEPFDLHLEEYYQEDDFTYEWSVNDDGLQKYLATMPTSSIRISEEFLTPGRAYMFTIRTGVAGPCAVGTCYGSLSVEVVINRPPHGGMCSASPSEGRQLMDPFTMSCEGWTDEHLPLAYSFGFSVEGEDVFFGRSLSNEMDVYLTMDTTDLIVKVSLLI